MSSSTLPDTLPDAQPGRGLEWPESIRRFSRADGWSMATCRRSLATFCQGQTRFQPPKFRWWRSPRHTVRRSPARCFASATGNRFRNVGRP